MRAAVLAGRLRSAPRARGCASLEGFLVPRRLASKARATRVVGIGWATVAVLVPELGIVPGGTRARRAAIGGPIGGARGVVVVVIRVIVIIDVITVMVVNEVVAMVVGVG